MPDTVRTSTVLHPASGALILGLDWLLFSENALTLGLSTLLIVAVGFSVYGIFLVGWLTIPLGIVAGYSLGAIRLAG